ncbi:MAG: hypothetical protein WCK32_06620 [Chlorobiaceae bacterium]
MKQFLLMISLGWMFNSAVAAYAAENTVQLAVFDHNRLSPSAQCIRCHERDQPDDNLHRKSQANCSACHNTRQWKPIIIKP